MSLEATFFSSYPQLILTGMVVLIAQAIYVLFGFGLGLIGVGLLAMFIQPFTNIVVLLLFIALPAEIYVLCKSWQKYFMAGNHRHYLRGCGRDCCGNNGPEIWGA